MRFYQDIKSVIRWVSSQKSEPSQSIEINQSRTRKECYDIGLVLGLIAGESSGCLAAALVVVTMVKGAVVEVEGCVALPLGITGAPGGNCVGDSSSSSGMGGQYVFRTCLRAGRRMGLERKKSMPDSRHSWS